MTHVNNHCIAHQNFSFGDVLAEVTVVVCLSSLWQICTSSSLDYQNSFLFFLYYLHLHYPDLGMEFFGSIVTHLSSERSIERVQCPQTYIQSTQSLVLADQRASPRTNFNKQSGDIPYKVLVARQCSPCSHKLSFNRLRSLHA